MKQRKKSRFLGAACFAVVLAAVFGHSLLTLFKYAASSQLYSYILLIPFVSATCFTSAGSTAEKYSVDLPLRSHPGCRHRPFCLAHSLELGQSPNVNTRIVC
jgi:hypothetical protein